MGPATNSTPTSNPYQDPRDKWFARIVKFLSMAISICLIILSIFGFKRLGSSDISSVAEVEAGTSDGCLCFLGFSFGVLLLLGETRIEKFFFFFGFLRYRFGRSVIYTIAGIMTLLMGRSLGSHCNCNSYIVLVIEGIALLVMGFIQVLSIIQFGNNTAPHPAAVEKTITLTMGGDGDNVRVSSDQKIKTEPSQKGKAPKAIEAPSPSGSDASSPPPGKSKAKNENSHLPAWMQA